MPMKSSAEAAAAGPAAQSILDALDGVDVATLARQVDTTALVAFAAALQKGTGAPSRPSGQPLAQADALRAQMGIPPRGASATRVTILAGVQKFPLLTPEQARRNLARLEAKVGR